MKIIPINYIEVKEDVKSIRDTQDEVAIGRYMEKYESGTSKPIIVTRRGRDKYILIDGWHRLQAKIKLKNNKIDCEIVDIEDKDIYSYAVECNQEHGVPLTKEEEEKVLINLFEEGKTQEEIAKVFRITQQAISKRINSSEILKKQLSSKICISTTNELLVGKKQKDVACIYSITQQRVSQIWGDFTNEINELYETGIPKQEIVEIENEKKINLTLEKLNELIEEDYNKLIIGDCLKEIPKLEDNSIDCLIIDPPYGQNYQSHHRKDKFDKIKNDKDEAFKLLDKSLKLIKLKMNKNSHIYIFTSWKVIEKVKPIVEEHFDLKNCLIWDKINHGSGDTTNGNYSERYELILFAKQGNKKLSIDKIPENILPFKKVNESSMIHQTEKPVELLKYLINNSTKEKELVVDYFAGSGSTLQASKECGRRWIGIELSKEFNEVS